MQYLFHLPSYGWHGVCLSVFVCGNYVGHWVCLFVCCLGDLCLALRLYVISGNYVLHWVCLFVGWVNYVGHWVCLLVG